jgi:hypothetical protein
VKGDRVEVVVDIGDGTRTYEIVASRAGRRIETATVRGVVEVTEVTRNGTPVRTARFMANRVVAIVEHPTEDGTDNESPPSRRLRSVDPNSQSLDFDGS